MDTTPSQNIATLGEQSDYRVCAEDTDPRGWIINDVNGVSVGVVTDLIIDLDALVARYIVCALSGTSQRTVLLPIGFARFADDGIVHLDFISAAAISQLPTYTGLPLSAEHEAQIEKALTGITPTSRPSKITRRSSDVHAAS